MTAEPLASERARNAESPAMTEESIVFMSEGYAIEQLEERWLLLLIREHQLFELNATAGKIVILTDGKRTIREVAEAMAAEYDVQQENAADDVADVYRMLLTWGLAEVRDSSSPTSPSRTADSTRYSRNVEVELAHSDSHGGLLMNRNTSDVWLLNSTARFIWEACNGTETVADIVKSLTAALEEAPVNEIESDVVSFLEELAAADLLEKVR